MYFFSFLGAEEEEEAVEIEVAEVAEEEEVVAIAIIKMPVATSAKTWIISNLNIQDMGIENVIQIIETQEDIREVAVEEAEIIEEIRVRIMVKITIKIMAKAMTINNHSILAKEILMEVTIEVETIIKTGERMEEGKGVEEEVEFKVDGIKVAIIMARIIINGAAIIEAGVDNTEF